MTFTQLVHKYTGGRPFLIGVLIFSIGSLLGLVLGLVPTALQTTNSIDPFVAMGPTIGLVFGAVWGLARLALPIIGLFMLYAAARNSKLPERSLTALTLFQVFAIASLVLVGLLILVVIGLVALALIVRAVAAPGFGGAETALFAILGGILFVIFAIVITFLILYYKSLLQLLGGIKKNIKFNTFAPIRGVTMFSVLSYISIGLGILGAIGTAAISGFMQVFFDDMMRQVMQEMPYYMQSEFYYALDAVGFVLSPGFIALSMLVSLATYAGMIVLIVTLNKFANELKQGRIEVFERDDSRGYSNAEQAARLSVPIGGIGYERDNDGLGERRPDERVSDGFGDEGRND